MAGTSLDLHSVHLCVGIFSARMSLQCLRDYVSVNSLLQNDFTSKQYFHDYFFPLFWKFLHCHEHWCYSLVRQNKLNAIIINVSFSVQG